MKMITGQFHTLIFDQTIIMIIKKWSMSMVIVTMLTKNIAIIRINGGQKTVHMSITEDKIDYKEKFRLDWSLSVEKIQILKK